MLCSFACALFAFLFHRPIGRARSAQRRASATRDRARASMKSSSKRIRRAATMAMTEAIGHSMRCRSRAPPESFLSLRPRRAACAALFTFTVTKLNSISTHTLLPRRPRAQLLLQARNLSLLRVELRAQALAIASQLIDVRAELAHLSCVARLERSELTL